MYNAILVPVDLNEKGFSDKALAHALFLARSSGAKLHLINVLPGVHMPMVASYFPEDAVKAMKKASQEQLQQFAATHIDAGEFDYQLHLSEGKPYREILKAVERFKIDLIVMPSHKRSHVDRVMLGSVASKVVEHSPVPVLIIKP